jgi:hypothetical protein
MSPSFSIAHQNLLIWTEGEQKITLPLRKTQVTGKNKVALAQLCAELARCH